MGNPKKRNGLPQKSRRKFLDMKAVWQPNVGWAATARKGKKNLKGENGKMNRRSGKLCMATVLLLASVALMTNAPIGKARGAVQVANSSASSLTPPTAWNQTYGGTGADYGYSVVQTSDGGYAVAGYTSSFGAVGGDCYLVRTNYAGSMLWNKTYGGTGYEEADSVVQTGDGGYAIAGYTNSFGAGGSDFYLVKTDYYGSMLWNKTYGGTGTDYGYSVIQTSDGGYAVAGYTNSFGAVGGDCYLVRTDSSGTLLWNKTYGGTGTDYGYSVIQTSDGGYAVAGYTNSFGAVGGDCYLVRTDSSGTLLWNKTYGGTGTDYGYSVVQTGDGGYAIAGYTNSFGAVGGDCYLVRTDSSGTLLWNKTYGGAGGDVAWSVVQTSDGGYAVAGYTNSFGAGGYDFYLVRTNYAGSMLWNQTYGGTGADYGYSVVQASDGGLVLAGDTNSFGAGGYDVWLVRTAGKAVPSYVIQTTAYRWVEIGDGAAGFCLGDDNVQTITTPFPINFYDDLYTNLTVGSNGNINFEDKYLGLGNTPIPTQNGYGVERLIGVFWDDLNMRTAISHGVAFYGLLGAAPNRMLVLEWSDVAHYYDVDNATFEAIFYENSSDIVFQYQDVYFGSSSIDYGASATVGIQYNPGWGTQFSYNTASLQNNSALRLSIVRPSAVQSLASAIMQDQAQTVYYLRTGNIYDDSALGFVYGKSAQSQNIISQNNPTFINQTSGAPLVSGDIVIFGGRFASKVMQYYESQGLAMVWLDANATYYTFKRIDNGQTLYPVAISTYNPNVMDYFVIQTFKDGNRTVLSQWGMSAQGTYASGLCFADLVWPHIGDFVYSFYIYSWQDLNGDGIQTSNEMSLITSGS